MGKPFFKDKKQSATKEKKAQKDKSPKKRTAYQRNKVRIVIWVVIILFILSSALAIVRSNVLGLKVSAYKEKIAVLDQRLNQLEKQQTLDVPTTNAFLRDFAKVYCERSKDHDEQVARKEKLGHYYSLLSYQDAQIPMVDTEVVSIENYGYETTGNHYVGKCYVEMATKEESPKTFRFILTIPFSVKNQKYQICGLPYQQSDTRKKVVTTNKGSDHHSPTTVLQDMKVTETVQDFVKQFLAEYATDDRGNLKYLMREVESLPKGVKVNSEEFKVYGTEKHPVAEFVLKVAYPDTGIEFQENMQLKLSKTSDGKYFIDQVVHY